MYHDEEVAHTAVHLRTGHAGICRGSARTGYRRGFRRCSEDGQAQKHDTQQGDAYNNEEKEETDECGEDKGGHLTKEDCCNAIGDGAPENGSAPELDSAAVLQLLRPLAGPGIPGLLKAERPEQSPEGLAGAAAFLHH